MSESQRTTVEMWAATQPIAFNDPYDSYLLTLYHKTEIELRRSLPVVSMDTATDPAALTQRTITNKAGKLVQMQDVLTNKPSQTLLIADAGAGKTFSMRSLVRDAIHKRLEDLGNPLPIYAQIRRWNVQKKPELAHWLSAQCNIATEDIEKLIKDGSVLLILDGLDDLKLKYSRQTPDGTDPRQPFLDMLPTTCPVIISTTTEDAATISLPTVNRMLTVHPFSGTQIRDYLQSSPQTSAIWDAVQSHGLIKSVISKPVLLHMFAVAFAKDTAGIEDLGKLNVGAIRDAIFHAYVTRRYEQASARHDGEVPFKLEQVLRILGMVAKRGVIRYGTGEAVWVDIDERHWEDVLVIDDLRFGFLGTSSPHGSEFIEFVRQLHLITMPQDGMAMCTFAHPIIRDLLVMRECLPVEEKLDSSTIESLMRISDERKYEIFAKVLTEDFQFNQRMQAYIALEMDRSQASTNTLKKLAKTFEHEFFSGRIVDSLVKRGELPQPSAPAQT